MTSSLAFNALPHLRETECCVERWTRFYFVVSSSHTLPLPFSSLPCPALPCPSVELERHQVILEEAQRAYEPHERRMNEAQAEVNLATTQLNLARERVRGDGAMGGEGRTIGE